MESRSIVTTSLITVLALSIISCTSIPAATPAPSANKASSATNKSGLMGLRNRIFKQKTESLPAALPLRRIKSSPRTCPTPNLRAALARSKKNPYKK